jgi:hypothetical protein
MRLLLVFIASNILCSCLNNEGKRNQTVEENRISIQVDTFKQKELVISRSKLINMALQYSDTSEGLNPSIDTIELTDMRFACDCPSWFDSISYFAKFLDKSTIDELDINSSSFKDNCYYIEPAEEKLNFASLSFLHGTRVKLFGRKYKLKKLPTNNLLQDPNPSIGNVFRYYGFEIIRPFKVYSNEFKNRIESAETETEERLFILTIE